MKQINCYEMESDKLSVTSTRMLKPDVILFAFQVLIIFIVVCASLFNLTFEKGNQNLWTVILTGSLGYIMPNPKLKNVSEEISFDKKKSNNNNL